MAKRARKKKTEGLTKSKVIEIDGTIEAMLLDLTRRREADEIISLKFVAIDRNDNILAGVSHEV